MGSGGVRSWVIGGLRRFLVVLGCWRWWEIGSVGGGGMSLGR